MILNYDFFFKKKNQAHFFFYILKGNFLLGRKILKLLRSKTEMKIQLTNVSASGPEDQHVSMVALFWTFFRKGRD